MGDQLQWMGRDEVVSGEGANRQPHRSMQEPQHSISYSSVASHHDRKTPKFSAFNGDLTQEGDVSFEQWAFQVKSHTVATLWEGIVCSLWGTTADLI